MTTKKFMKNRKRVITYVDVGKPFAIDHTFIYFYDKKKGIITRVAEDNGTIIGNTIKIKGLTEKDFKFLELISILVPGMVAIKEIDIKHTKIKPHKDQVFIVKCLKMGCEYFRDSQCLANNKDKLHLGCKVKPKKKNTKFKKK